MKNHRTCFRTIVGLSLALVATTGLAAQSAPQGAKQGTPAQPISGPRGGGFFQQRIEAAPVGDQTIQFLSAGYFAGEIVEGAPYSAEAVTETVQTLGDGNRITQKHSALIYRDGQGRTRREQTFGAIGPWATAGEPVKTVFINDPVGNLHYVLDPQTRTARKMMPPRLQFKNVEGETGASDPGHDVMFERNVEVRDFTWVAGSGGENVTREGGYDVKIQAPPQPFSKPLSQPPAVESLGKRVIEGVEAEGTRTTIMIPAGEIGNERPIEIVSERWHSPELQTLVMSAHRDPRFAETVYRLTNIQRVEPLPSLFEVPADYKIEEADHMMHGIRPRREEHVAEPNTGREDQ